jgi:hypothetical protein
MITQSRISTISHPQYLVYNKIQRGGRAQGFSEMGQQRSHVKEQEKRDQRLRKRQTMEAKP